MSTNFNAKFPPNGYKSVRIIEFLPNIPSPENTIYGKQAKDIWIFSNYVCLFSGIEKNQNSIDLQLTLFSLEFEENRNQNVIENSLTEDAQQSIYCNFAIVTFTFVNECILTPS